MARSISTIDGALLKDKLGALDDKKKDKLIEAEKAETGNVSTCRPASTELDLLN